MAQPEFLLNFHWRKLSQARHREIGQKRAESSSPPARKRETRRRRHVACEEVWTPYANTTETTKPAMRTMSPTREEPRRAPIRHVTLKAIARFTKQADQALVAARKHAAQESRNISGSDVLSALVEQPRSTAGRVLAEFGADKDKISAALGFVRVPTARSGHRTAGSPEPEDLVNAAIGQSIRLGHPYVATSDLLLAVASDTTSAGAGVLSVLGVDLTRISARAASFRGESSDESGPDS
jgi:hypothetical protein